jgi:hypothetical protein
VQHYLWRAVDQDHTAVLGRNAIVVSRTRPSAQTVIGENSPSSAGVVRRAARSDH